MREFILTNAQGKTWNLNDTASFFHSIKGLGQEHKVTYLQIGTNFVKEKDLLAQKSITGKIKFADYKTFNLFSQFIQHKPLILTYVSHAKFGIKVSIDKLAKTEVQTGGLNCDVTFKSLGTFYKSVVKENLRSEEDNNAGKKYEFTYPYQYHDTANGTVMIESDSTMQSPVKINIFGPVTNPSYTHYVNNAVVATGKIDVSIEEGNKIVVDTTQIPYSIKEYTVNNEYVQDLYAKSDFSTERFLLLERGENKIYFMHESSEHINVSVEAMIEYESV